MVESLYIGYFYNHISIYICYLSLASVGVWWSWLSFDPKINGQDCNGHDSIGGLLIRVGLFRKDAAGGADGARSLAAGPGPGRAGPGLGSPMDPSALSGVGACDGCLRKLGHACVCVNVRVIGTAQKLGKRESGRSVLVCVCESE